MDRVFDLITDLEARVQADHRETVSRFHATAAELRVALARAEARAEIDETKVEMPTATELGDLRRLSVLCDELAALTSYQQRVTAQVRSTREAVTSALAASLPA